MRTNRRRRSENVRQLYALLRGYDQEKIAEVGCRLRDACTTARPEDAEAHALIVTLDVLRLRHREPIPPIRLGALDR